MPRSFSGMGKSATKSTIRRTFNIIPCNLLLQACLNQYPTPTPQGLRIGTPPVFQRGLSLTGVALADLGVEKSQQIHLPSIRNFRHHHWRAWWLCVSNGGEISTNGWGGKRWQSQNQLEIVEIYQFGVVFTN